MREVKVYVNDAPQAPPAGLGKHVVDEDVASDHASATYVVPAFTDEEDDAANKGLEYGAQRVLSGTPGALPPWITFDKDTRTFTFKPLASHVGSYTLRVRGTDSGGLSAEAEFVLTVSEFNDAPVASSLQDQQVDEDVASDHASATYLVPKFTDEEEDKASRSLLYTAFWAEKNSAGNDRVDANGKKVFVSLPRWIVFDGLKRRFTFEPDKSWHAGRYTLRVVGTEKGISGKPIPKATLRSLFWMSWR